MRALVEKYQLGSITDNHLVVESLHMIDPENPGLVLSSLPENTRQRMFQFAMEYLRDRMVTNYGVLPTENQALAASRWFKDVLQQKANETA